MVIGMDSVYCYTCKRITAHQLIKNDVCVAKICVSCINQINHPFGKGVDPLSTATAITARQ